MFKKAIFVIIILAGLFVSVFVYSQNSIKQTIGYPAQSQSDLCNDALIMFLNPTIQQGVDNYYKKYLTEAPGVGSASVKILNISKDALGGYDITVNVSPYYGPHNSVGEDEMLLHVKGNSTEIKSFKHLESYQIYGSYRDYIIQWPPA